MRKTSNFSTSDLFLVRAVDCLLSALLIITLFPLIMFEAIKAILLGLPLWVVRLELDALQRPLATRSLATGNYKSLGLLFDVAIGKLSLFGLELPPQSYTFNPTPALLKDSAKNLKPGIFCLAALRKASGLVYGDPNALIREHIENFCFSYYLKNLVKSCLNSLFFSARKLKSPRKFRLFGLSINNTTMSRAVAWTCKKNEPVGTKLGFFVNVNSVNLSFDDKSFLQTINSAERVFADGSGVRLGARHIGVALKDNINGTDLLPLLCEQAQEQSLSIFLLGAEPGLAKKAARKLKAQYPKLKISGCHHGYFEKEGSQSDDVVSLINNSNTDILLTGFGSPVQEQWLAQNKNKLDVRTAMAVGGLFDFFSGSVVRAPLWMREIGMEWVWRLLQQPTNKWRRYVLGNPWFLYRLWFNYND